jgi:hypothetical protein
MQFMCRFWDHSWCLWCQEDSETTAHVLLCKGRGGGKPRMDELSHESGDLADWSGYSSFDSTVHYRKSYGMITNNIFCLPFWPGKSRCSIRAGWDWLAKLCGGQNIKELGWPSICLLPWITFKTFGGPMDFWIGVPPAGGNLWYVDTSK